MEKTSILIVFMLIWLALSGCVYEEIEDKTDKDVLIMAVFNSDSIYPYSRNTITPNIYNGLVEFDENFQI